MRQARSHVGSRLAVASSAKISLPRFPDGGGGGKRRHSRRNASTFAARESARGWRLQNATHLAQNRIDLCRSGFGRKLALLVCPIQQLIKPSSRKSLYPVA